MTRVETVEHEVAALTPEELAEFREWFVAFDGEVWDQQIEADARSGKLDDLAARALQTLRSGKCSEL